MREKVAERPEIILGLLTSVERHGSPTQRHLAAELGIALGLVNAYLKRCVKKGLVKVNEAPARRYAYYLTPKGFAEKSRLTVEYLATSFSFFRKAREDCAEAFQAAAARGWRRVALAGVSDLAEICVLSALDSGVEIVAIVDAGTRETSVAGVPVFKSYDAAPDFEGIVVTDLGRPSEAFTIATGVVGSERVLAPALLKLETTIAEKRDGTDKQNSDLAERRIPMSRRANARKKSA